MAILLISTELEECFALADRLAVMFDGEILQVMSRGEWNLERVGLLIAGVRETKPQQECKEEANA